MKKAEMYPDDKNAWDEDRPQQPKTPLTAIPADELEGLIGKLRECRVKISEMSIAIEFYRKQAEEAARLRGILERFATCGIDEEDTVVDEILREFRDE